MTLEPLSRQVDIHLRKSGSFQSEFRIKPGPVFGVGPIAPALSKSGTYQGVDNSIPFTRTKRLLVTEGSRPEDD